MLERVGVILLLSLALIELEYDWKIFSLLLLSVFLPLHFYDNRSMSKRTSKSKDCRF